MFHVRACGGPRTDVPAAAGGGEEDILQRRMAAAERAEAAALLREARRSGLAEVAVVRGGESELAETRGVGLALCGELELGVDRGEERGQRGEVAGELEPGKWSGRGFRGAGRRRCPGRRRGPG